MCSLSAHKLRHDQGMMRQCLVVTCSVSLGAIQVLRKAVGGGRVSDFSEKNVTMLLALRRGGWVGVEFPEKFHNT